MTTQHFSIQIADSLQAVSQADWDALHDDQPFLKYHFLLALESTACVGGHTGWHPHYLLLKHQNTLVGALPLYLKTHSYGEYVFDWAWADAYQRSGLEYYPKLLCAVPFTPATGARLLTRDAAIKPHLVQALEACLQEYQLSSAHVNFPDAASAKALEDAGWLKRSGVQFRWQNKNYTSFEDFLNSLSHDKRKKIHQERNKIAAAGVHCKWIKGAEITESDWDFFYQCYCNTYQQHRSTPYLTRDFFSQLSQAMPENVLMIVAEQANQRIAATLNMYTQHTLYGRYWGATQFVSGLHFELCYYQAQRFCIAENIQFFEGGAQGEHKLARGFKPRPTCSYHKIAHPKFAEVIAQFVRREAAGVAAYTNELEERAPFKAL